jgi:hypothetical protein
LAGAVACFPTLQKRLRTEVFLHETIIWCLPQCCIQQLLLLLLLLSTLQKRLRTEVFLRETIPWWLAPVGYGGLVSCCCCCCQRQRQLMLLNFDMGPHDYWSGVICTTLSLNSALAYPAFPGGWEPVC